MSKILRPPNRGIRTKLSRNNFLVSSLVKSEMSVAGTISTGLWSGWLGWLAFLTSCQQFTRHKAQLGLLTHMALAKIIFAKHMNW